VSSLTALAAEPRTMVFFESPNRLAASLDDIAATLGADRRVVVCRELTKFFEEIKRGTAAELAEWAAAGVKGEICIVIAGAEVRVLSLEAGVAEVLAMVADGIRLKEAAAEVSAASGLGKRELYERALQAKSGRSEALPDRSDFPLG